MLQKYLQKKIFGNEIKTFCGICDSYISFIRKNNSPIDDDWYCKKCCKSNFTFLKKYNKYVIYFHIYLQKKSFIFEFYNGDKQSIIIKEEKDWLFTEFEISKQLASSFRFESIINFTTNLENFIILE